MSLALKVNCRACNRECGDYKHLQDETIINEKSTTLAALLNYCTTLDCLREYHQNVMPAHVCNSCVEHLKQSYLFKEMVLQNDKVFRDRIQKESLKNKDAEVVVDEQNVKKAFDVQAVEKDIKMEEFIPENELVERTDEDAGEEIVESTDEEAVGKNIKMKEFIPENELIERNDDDAENKYGKRLQIDKSEWENNNKQVARQALVYPDKISIINEVNCEEMLVKNEAILENCEDNLSTLNGSDGDEVLKVFGESKKTDDLGKNCAERLLEENTTEKAVKRKSLKTNTLTEADLTCRCCGKIFDLMCQLRVHRYVHREKTHECKICGRRTRTKSQYNVHILTHSDEKRFKCSICNRSYRTITDLRIHERKHTNKRPYACDLCDKTFYTPKQRKRHFMDHTGERPFICSTCGKTYRESHSLKKHMITHEEVKPYKCEVCGKRLSHMSSFKRHMQIHKRVSI